MNSTPTCYIIDDSEIDVYMLERVLADSGSLCRFEKFSNGKDALQALQATAVFDGFLPKLILLDLNMPICDGWEFLSSAQSIPGIEKCRIVVVSSTIDPAEQDRARRHPLVTNFITKPVTTDCLNDVLYT